MDKTRQIEKGKNEVEGIFFRKRYPVVDASMSIRRKLCESTASLYGKHPSLSIPENCTFITLTYQAI